MICAQALIKFIARACVHGMCCFFLSASYFLISSSDTVSYCEGDKTVSDGAVSIKVQYRKQKLNKQRYSKIQRDSVTQNRKHCEESS